MKKRLFVLSVDAMVQEDVQYLLQKPGSNFAKFYENCSGPESLRTIYPSLTYPVHVTLQTGCFPGETGVFTNYIFDTDHTYRDWTWDYRLIRRETIFEAAKKAGYTTGAAFWPVTAYNPYIDYHLPEYWLHHTGDTLRGTFMEMGASSQIADYMERHAHLLPPGYERTGKQNFTIEPAFDDFMLHVALDMIRECKPEVMFMHGCVVDSFRHAHGVFCEEVNEALDMVDVWLGMVFDAFREAGTFEETNFVILSDHGQMNVIRKVRPNILLAQNGLIDVDDKGKVADYRAYGMAGGLSMPVWLKDPGDREVYERTYRLLSEKAEEGVWGFRQVLRREAVKEKYGLDGEFSFILESDGYSTFGDQVTGPYATDLPMNRHNMGVGDHGHLPDRGPQPIFLAKGPDLRENVMLPRRDAVDVAPTLAKLLGIELPEARGRAMAELLRKV